MDDEHESNEQGAGVGYPQLFFFIRRLLEHVYGKSLKEHEYSAGV